jgi:TrbL/VirB6 plasmid conjugal transfer protein
VLCLITVNLILVNCETWIKLSAGLIFLGFGAAEWTRDLSVSYYKHLLAVGIKQFVTLLLAGIGLDIMNQRNRVMHSTGTPAVHGPAVYKIILKSFKFLMPGQSWFKEREKHLESDELAVLYSADHVSFRVIKEALRAIEYLEPADCRDLLDFNKRKRRYLCPACEMELHAMESEGAYLCQFPQDNPGQAVVQCYLCEQSFVVERKPCSATDCQGDVIWAEEQWCLSCGEHQPDDG